MPTEDWLREDCLELHREFVSQNATRVSKRARLLRLGLNQALGLTKTSANPLFLEFGVHEGKDIARMAVFLAYQQAITDKHLVMHGFDSFEGLPEDWDNGQTLDAPVGEESNKNDELKFAAGAFSTNGEEPCYEKMRTNLDLGKHGTTADCDSDAITAMQKNIKFHPGWFHETLPKFLDEQQESSLSTPTVTFVHADADLYSSTKCFLTALAERKLWKKGSILVFDEFWNYPHWQDGEYQAWMETVDEYHIEYVYLGYHSPKPRAPTNTYGYQSVCVMITRDMV